MKRKREKETGIKEPELPNEVKLLQKELKKQQMHNKFLEEMTIVEFKKMWGKFGDIPINSDDEIEADFYGWEKGTYRFDIWHWFDEKLPNGIVKDINMNETHSKIKLLKHFKIKDYEQRYY